MSRLVLKYHATRGKEVINLLEMLGANRCYKGCNGYWYEDDFDCGTNEELFLALAALRDDNDYMQWFTNGEKWIQNKQNDTEVIRYGTSNPINFHKATVKEIIENFK